MLLLFYLLSALASDTPRVAAPKTAFPPRAVTACAVVTRAEIEDAIGRRLTGRQEEMDGASSTCDYSAGGGMVSIAIQRLASRPDWRVELAALKKSIPEAVAREAPGLADAFYLDIPDAGTQLHVLAGSEHLMVSILGFGDAATVSGAAARIARKALPRL